MDGSRASSRLLESIGILRVRLVGHERNCGYGIAVYPVGW
jgi:hypothetical protein